MVQILNDSYSGNVFGRLGKGIGQGLSEQLPKELERGRLSSGLAGLKQQAEGGASALDLLTKAYTTPGLTPEMAQNILPYLQDAGLQSQKPKQPNNQQPEANGQPKEHEDYRAIGTLEGMENRARELQRSNPLQYSTLDKARAAADTEYKNQQSSIQNIRSQFDTSLARKIQAQGTETFKDVLGDLQEDFINKAEKDVLTGKLSEKEAINKYTKQALDFAKTKTDLDALSFGGIFDRKDTFNNLDAIKQKYKQLGRLEDFNNEVISKFGFTRQNASSLTYPVSKELNGYLKGIKKEGVGPTYRKGGDLKGVVNRISDDISEDDSLFTIAKELEAKNYDPRQFMKEATDAWKQGTLRLNERQAGELSKSAIERPSLGDLLFFKLWGKPVLGE